MRLLQLWRRSLILTTSFSEPTFPLPRRPQSGNSGACSTTSVLPVLTWTRCMGKTQPDCLPARRSRSAAPRVVAHHLSGHDALDFSGFCGSAHVLLHPPHHRGRGLPPQCSVVTPHRDDDAHAAERRRISARRTWICP